jgi:hypothetical protein
VLSLQTITGRSEEIEDVVGAQFNNANHTNITAVYDDISGEVRLTGSVGGAGGQVDSVVGGTGITVQMQQTRLIL